MKNFLNQQYILNAIDGCINEYSKKLKVGGGKFSYHRSSQHVTVLEQK